MTRVIGPPKSPRRKWTFLCALLIATSVGVLYIAGAGAWTQASNGVESTGMFELDGNTATTTALGTLSVAITSTSATSISVNIGGNTPPSVPFIIKIGAEYMNVTAISASGTTRTLTVTRGYQGSTAATAAINAPVAVASSNPPSSACGPPDDWAALYQNRASTNDCSAYAFAFINDQTGANDTTYWQGGGSKDAYDPALGPWLWGPNNVSPDKNDIVNAFAALYNVTDTSNSKNHKILFVGSDRFAVNGDAQMGYQFLQNAACLAGPVSGVTSSEAPCPGTTPTAPTGCTPAFTSSNAGYFVDPTTGCPVHHANGDILLLVNFNNGGTLGLSGVFVWACNTGGCATGGQFNQVLSAGATAGSTADCAFVGDPNRFCAIPNRSPLPGEPVWPYTAKGGGTSYDTSAFVEGGVDLTQIQGAGTCFPNFFAETRSSAGPSSGLGLTAQLKDIAFGKFELCNTQVKTTPQDSSGNTIGTDTSSTGNSVSVGTGATGVDVQDKAVITVNGADSFAGTVSFHLCGPMATSSAATCDSGGALVKVNGSDPTTIGPPSPVTITSDTAHLTEVGRYCFRADYSGDSSTGVPGGSDHSSTECFVVTPVKPGVVTQAVDSTGAALTGSVNFNTPIYDSATLSGTADERGTNGATGTGLDGSINATTRKAHAQGTITFKLYGPDDPGSTTNCGTVYAPFATAFPNGIVVTVNGDATYDTTAHGFTPSVPGVYHWKAVYSGDTDTAGGSGAANTLASDEYNTSCNHSAEDVTVVQLQTKTKTTPQDTTPTTIGTVLTGSNVQDYAVISDQTSGGGSPTGTVDFFICGPGAGTGNGVTGTGTSAHCASGTGASVQTGAILSSGPSADQSQATSSTYKVNGVGVWCFRATYTPDTTKFVTSDDSTNGECFNVVDVGMTTTQSFTITDTAHITASGPGAKVGGTGSSVEFQLYSGGDCSGATLSDQTNTTVPLGTSADVALPNPVTIDASTTGLPTLSWLVIYTPGTGATNKTVTEACNVQKSSLTITNGS